MNTTLDWESVIYSQLQDGKSLVYKTLPEAHIPDLLLPQIPEQLRKGHGILIILTGKRLTVVHKGITTEAQKIRKLYASANSVESTFVFKIPVFENMPARPCAVPGTEGPVEETFDITLALPAGYDDTTGR